MHKLNKIIIALVLIVSVFSIASSNTSRVLGVVVSLDGNLKYISNQ